MRKRELMREIDIAFEEAGQKDEWIYRSYKNLLELNQLVHFQIFEINWFNGAAKIIQLVDQLHTQTTPKEDFLLLAEMLEIPVKDNITKKELVARVKGNPNWRVKAFDLEREKAKYHRRQALQPLYDHLASLGYRANVLPREITRGKWMLDATNHEGLKETIYLNESENRDSILIQSTFNDFIDLYRGAKHLFVQSITG